MSGDTLLGIAALLTAIVSNGLLIYNTIMARRRDKTLAHVQMLVNDLSDKRARASRKAGKIEGANKERAHPTPKK